MTDKLCFIIPVLNECDTLPVLLGQLRTRFPNCQRVFVDGGSVDGTPALLQSSGECCINSGKGRARQMNAGAAYSEAQYLLFLHADTAPLFSEQDLFDVLQNQPAWGFCPVVFDSSRPVFRIIAFFMNVRSRLSGIATGDQLLWLQKALFERIEGFADIPLMEDVELCQRLRKVEKPCVFPHKVKTSARRWQQRGVLRTVLLMWALRAAYFCGVSPARLHAWY